MSSLKDSLQQLNSRLTPPYALNVSVPGLKEAIPIHFLEVVDLGDYVALGDERQRPEARTYRVVSTAHLDVCLTPRYFAELETPEQVAAREANAAQIGDGVQEAAYLVPVPRRTGLY